MGDKKMFMKYALKRLDEKKMKKKQKERDIYAVKEAGWKKNKFRVGEL